MKKSTASDVENLELQLNSNGTRTGEKQVLGLSLPPIPSQSTASTLPTFGMDKMSSKLLK